MRLSNTKLRICFTVVFLEVDRLTSFPEACLKSLAISALPCSLEAVQIDRVGHKSSPGCTPGFYGR